ncbi:adenosine receptor A2b-like [Actinia tenebrosa]|uniref:Adenosine receptor A2b-like n=1 Tax=Actinia tenebrosa TaxID=6105 RepID=A0A6P8IGB7_ACTTE|nr:adenosine receptor A2b-like [Actinia tenebrosa]
MSLAGNCISVTYKISQSVTSSDNSTLLFFGVFNSALAVPTAAANALVIVAILTTSSLRTPSYLLLTSLAFSDLAVGLFCQPLLALLVYTFLNGFIDIGCHLLWACYAISCLVSWASIFIITAISVDRYLAIRLKMRYKTIVTVRRVRCFLFMLWISSFILMMIPPVLDMEVEMFGVVAAISLVTFLLVIVVSYTMSFRALKIHCAQIQPQSNQQPNSTTQSNVIDVLKYRKLLKTMILIVVVILICYIAHSALFGILSVFGVKRVDALIYILGLVSIVNLNSLLNPIIYVTRMTDIGRVCIKILQKFRCIS